MASGQQLAHDVSSAVDQGIHLVARVAVLVDTVEALVSDVAEIAVRAALVVAKADAVAAAAGESVLLVHTQLLRTQGLLDVFAPSLLDLQPVLNRAASALEQRHV